LPAGVQIQPDPQGTVTWTEREADRYTLRVSTDKPALLVISENYYPAWKASVDGQPTTILRANYTFRAIPLPAGQHEVRLFYESDSLRRSALVSAGLLALLLLASLTLVLRRGREGVPA
jgi:uncharacterized membrane protein YfhO